jgi:hypothetical protein
VKRNLCGLPVVGQCDMLRLTGFRRELPRSRGNLIREQRFPADERLCRLYINLENRILTHRNLPVAGGRVSAIDVKFGSRSRLLTPQKAG